MIKFLPLFGKRTSTIGDQIELVYANVHHAVADHAICSSNRTVMESRKAHEGQSTDDEGPISYRV